MLDTEHLKTRWSKDLPFKHIYEAYASSMRVHPLDHLLTSGMFRGILAELPVMKDGFTDCRGFPASSSKGFTPMEYSDVEIAKVDFSYAALFGHTFRSTAFTQCRFEHTFFDAVTFARCVFEDCDFERSVHHECSAGPSTRYIRCNFIQSQMTGIEFSFDNGCNFQQCVFRDISAKRWRIGQAHFENCQFSGTAYILSVRPNIETIDVGFWRNLFWPKEVQHPASFVSCELSGLHVVEGSISNKTMFKISSLPAGIREERSDGIYYIPTSIS